MDRKPELKLKRRRENQTWILDYVIANTGVAHNFEYAPAVCGGLALRSLHGTYRAGHDRTVFISQGSSSGPYKGPSSPGWYA